MYEKLTRPDGRILRRQVRSVSGALADIERISCATERLEKKIAAAASALADVQTVALLSSMDVEELSRAKKGIRVSALKNAGINDLGQVYAMSRGRLESIDGIGELSAQAIYSAVRSIAGTTRRNIGVRLTAEDGSRELSALLAPLYEYILTDPARKKAAALYEKYGEAAEEALRRSKRALSAIGWLFSSTAGREEAARAAGVLSGLERSPFAHEAAEALEEYRAVMPPDEESARRALERSGAEFAVTLERLNAGAAAETGRSGVPAELAERVNARKLDLSLLRAALRPYQEFGTKYILTQRRTLLGDEMGLGKTVQAIAAMAALKAEGGERFLVVCPAGVLVNWCREVERHSALAVTEIHGSDRGDELRRWISVGTVAVTTYETARGMLLPEGFRLSMLVADEAHYVKNPYALRTRSLMSLASRSDHVLYMTGTPIENNVDEMCFLMSTLQSETAQAAEELKFMSDAPRFRETIAPVYLRRTREDVLKELPEKIEQEQWCRPTAADMRSYIASVMEKNFMAMRRVSWDHSDLDHSAKAQRLLEILELARGEGRKTVVFSYFRGTAEKVCTLAGENVFGPINGSVPAAKRQQLVDEFTAAPPGAVLVSQVTAGGTGLNIQAASVVVFCEPQIKPSMETQAVSRAYRMGQTHSVLVYRLLCTGTADESILALLRDKQEIFDSFADESALGSESIAAGSMQSWIDGVIAEQTQKLCGGQNAL